MNSAPLGAEFFIANKSNLKKCITAKLGKMSIFSYLQLILHILCCIITYYNIGGVYLFAKMEQQDNTKPIITIEQERYGIMGMNDFVLILLALLVFAAVMMLFVSSRHKKQMEAFTQINQQLKNLEAGSGSEIREPYAEEESQDNQAAEVALIAAITEEEKKDASEDMSEDTEASAYNTGTSGKIYTKEELELLIKE